jgi:hypothetical protein
VPLQKTDGSGSEDPAVSGLVVAFAGTAASNAVAPAHLRGFVFSTVVQDACLKYYLSPVEKPTYYNNALQGLHGLYRT